MTHQGDKGEKTLTIDEWLMKDWPIKMLEGDVRISRTAAGNPDSRYFAEIVFYTYDKQGFGFSKGTYAHGPTAQVALSLLWEKSLKEIVRLRDEKELPKGFDDWFICMMRRGVIK